MTFRASGSIASLQSLPRTEQMFNFTSVSWSYSFVGFGSPSKKVRESTGTLSIMQRKKAEDFLSNLMEKGSRATRHLEEGPIAIAWYYENIEEEISECHFLVGLDETDWLIVKDDLMFAWDNDLQVELRAFGGFADREMPDVRTPTPNQFEQGEALLLDSPSITIMRSQWSPDG